MEIVGATTADSLRMCSRRSHANVCDRELERRSLSRMLHNTITDQKRVFLSCYRVASHTRSNSSIINGKPIDRAETNYLSRTIFRTMQMRMPFSPTFIHNIITWNIFHYPAALRCAYICEYGHMRRFVPTPWVVQKKSRLILFFSTISGYRENIESLLRLYILI